MYTSKGKIITSEQNTDSHDRSLEYFIDHSARVETNPTTSNTIISSDKKNVFRSEDSLRLNQFLRSFTDTITTTTDANTNNSNHLHDDNNDENIPSFIDENEPSLQREILHMISQYLKDTGYETAARCVITSARLESEARSEIYIEAQDLKREIAEGQWTEVLKKLKDHGKPFRSNKGLCFEVCKQRYLEYIEEKEIQNAFAFLTKRLKPFELLQICSSEEFKDLCYLLTCETIHECERFKTWPGVRGSRERLLDRLNQWIQPAEPWSEETVPKSRLISLFNQAAALQVASHPYRTRVKPRVHTLLKDYSYNVVPNSPLSTLTGHKSNVKVVKILGSGRTIASGSSDSTILLWSKQEQGSNPSFRQSHVLCGHSSRIWDLGEIERSSLLISGSADGTVKLWDTSLLESSKEVTAEANSIKINMISSNRSGKGGEEERSRCRSTLTAPEISGDIYTVSYSQESGKLVSGGFDKSLSLFDPNSGSLIRRFLGHSGAVTSCCFMPSGTSIVSGSKDKTVRFWDTRGTSLGVLPRGSGEITSVAVSLNGQRILVASKDNTHRLWDLRHTSEPLIRYTGHQNSSKHFIRAGFCCVDESVVVSGSEDGGVYLWTTETGEWIETLVGHKSVVYGADWSSRHLILASASHDATVRLWQYK